MSTKQILKPVGSVFYRVSGTFSRLHCFQCVLDSPLGFGAVGVAPLVAVGGADAAEAHLVSSEEGDQEGLLLLRSVLSHQAGQPGFPPLACRGRQVEQKR